MEVSRLVQDPRYGGTRGGPVERVQLQGNQGPEEKRKKDIGLHLFDASCQ